MLRLPVLDKIRQKLLYGQEEAEKVEGVKQITYYWGRKEVLVNPLTGPYRRWYPVNSVVTEENFTFICRVIADSDKMTITFEEPRVVAVRFIPRSPVFRSAGRRHAGNPNRSPTQIS